MSIKRGLSLLTAAGLTVVAFLFVNPGCASTPEHAALGLWRIDQMQEKVGKTVHDPERARKVVALLDRLRAEFAEFNKGMTERRRELYALNANYDAKLTDFNAVWRKLQDERLALARAMLELRREGTRLLTADEWKAVHAGFDSDQSK